MKKIIYGLMFINMGFCYADSTSSLPQSTDGNVYFDIGLGAAKIDGLPTGSMILQLKVQYLLVMYLIYMGA